MHLHKTILFIFSIVLIGSVSARELTIDSALRLALKNNKNIQIARSDLEFSEARVDEAWSTALPKINIDMGYNRNFKDNFFYINASDSSGQTVTTKLDFTFKDQFAANATLTQTIYSFGKVGNALDIAYRFKDFSDLQFESSKQAILTDVKKAYYFALLTKEVLSVAEDSEQSAKENYENIKVRNEGGVASEFELLQAEVRWQNAIPSTIEARKNFELATNNLKSLLSLPIEESIELVWDKSSYPARPEKTTADEIFKTRPSYQALVLEQYMLQKNVKIEFANHLPDLSGSLAYTYSASSDRFQIENQNDNIVLGVSLNIPIYSGGFTNAQVQKARIEVDKVKKRLELNQDNIRIELNNIDLRMNEALSKIEAAEKNVKSARRAFEIAESRVANGLSTQLELKDSRIFLDQAQITRLTAIYSYLEAYFDWELLTGKVEYPNE